MSSEEIGFYPVSSEEVAEDEMVRKHHCLSGHELDQTLGESGRSSRRQGSLGCCSLWLSQRLDTASEQQEVLYC